MDKLSMLASFDDLRRCCGVLMDGNAEVEFVRFVQMFDQYQHNLMSTVQEAQRLQREVDDSFTKLADLESKLSHARKLLEMENKARREAEQERDGFEKKMNAVWEVFRNDRDIAQETRDKFSFLDNHPRKRKSAVGFSDKYKGNEINSTGSFLSDLSLTQSEDDFLDKSTKGWKEYRPSVTGNQVQVGGKRSRKSVDMLNMHKKRSMDINDTDKIVAHTKVSIPQEGDGPILAESIIEAIPQQVYQTPRNKKISSPNQYKTPLKMPDSQINAFQTPSAPPLSELQPNSKLTFGQNMLRPHSFVSRNFLRADSCNACQKKIRFGSVALKCRICRVRVHTDCSNNVHVACVPQNGTPNLKSDEAMGLIGDYTPTIGPMVPALIVHCVNEIETRGLQEVGLYRISGTEREVKVLKERFIRGKEVPCIGNIDVHVLCGCIKDFLRSLKECLIPTALWTEFSNAVQNVDDMKKSQELFSVINKLPQANRDTLAFLMQHFQRIANVPEVKMPITNIAKVFGPTIVGYSSPFPEQQAIFAETHIQFTVMRDLLNIPTDYWARFVNIEIERPVDNKDNYKTMDFYSKSGMKSAQKERKYYATPPYSNKKK